MKSLISALLASVYLLTSCTVPYRINTSFSAEKKTDENLETIVSAIQTKDAEQVKCLFSQNALSQVDDFDTQFEKLIEFLGEFANWEYDELHRTRTHSSYGEKTIKVAADGKMTTDKGEFIIQILDYPVDTIETDNQGVYMIYVASVDYDGIAYWRSVEKAGIYIPELDGTDDIDPHIVYGDSETPDGETDETDENSNPEKTDEPTERSSQEQHAEE
ncbi:MAG: DUF5104 domain-containing protein [Ruminococcaceae bacterium]|nr:DUF5104 domain-containing protein [Oscillospiraceae bacterium]